MDNSTSVNHKKSIGIVVCLLLLVFSYLNKDLIAGFFKKEKIGARLANVTSVKNEVRKKKTLSLDWNSANVNDSIHRGDSVSTGSASGALVQFINGEKLTLDQNTLIVFNQQDSTPEFVSGNITLTVNGSMKIKIDNEIVTINGKNANIQVFKDRKNNKQKIVLLKGESSISSKQNTVRLKTNKLVEAKEVTLKPVDFQNLQAQENLQRVVAQAPPTKPVEPGVIKIANYKLYDFYARTPGSALEFGLNKNFKEKPNTQFEIFSTAILQYKSKILVSEDKPTMAQFKITDTVSPLGYMIELSQTPVFSEETTRYFWARSTFEYPFDKVGTYYLRYRKVLKEQHLTVYSPTEQFNISQDLRLKITETKKQQRLKRPNEQKQAPLAAPAIADAKIITEPPLVLAPIERKPAAINEAQSVLQLTPEKLLRNIKFAESYVGAHVTQGYLVSNRQIENSRAYSQSYNLGFDIMRWGYNQGLKAEVNKSVVTSDSANSILLAEVNYMYRTLVASSWFDTNQFQLSGIAGFEYLSNSSNSVDFMNSYSLFKLGLGASLPLFSLWTADIELLYGMGSSSGTSLQFNSRLNYYFNQKLSLGLGFKARKYDFVLLDKKNSESLAETYTSLRYHY